jgi:hypothetical protein
MNPRDPDYQAVVDVMESDPFLILPAAILAEVTFVIERDFASHRLTQFLKSLIAGELTLFWDMNDLTRIDELVNRYRDVPLGFSDAAVIACAERHGGQVLTLDHRHFGVVAQEGTIQVRP